MDNDNNSNILNWIIIAIGIIVVLIILVLLLRKSSPTPMPQQEIVNKPQITLSLVNTNVTIKVNERGIINYNLSGGSKEEANLTFTSNDSSIVMVDSNGSYIGIKEGSTVIKIIYNSGDNTKEAYFNVSVVKEEKKEETNNSVSNSSGGVTSGGTSGGSSSGTSGGTSGGSSSGTSGGTSGGSSSGTTGGTSGGSSSGTSGNNGGTSGNNNGTSGNKGDQPQKGDDDYIEGFTCSKWDSNGKCIGWSRKF